MLAFSNDYYGFIFRATQSVELFCAYSPKTTTANHANKKSTNGKVKTGDNNHMILYTVSLVLSLMIAAGCIYTIISKRRKNR